jgi:ring-1,2-phenylacetyl-CoA epoxidase subunit PaaD
VTVVTVERRGALDRAGVLDALREVSDPEIPAISVVDLGVIGDVTVRDDAVRVELLPTFVGCPALDPMREAIRARLAAAATGRAIVVDVVFDPPWTSDRITPEGRRALTASGFALPTPPGPSEASSILVTLDAPVACPYCGSSRTRLENAFGPTACRSIRFCTACRQPFEQFKTV